MLTKGYGVAYIISIFIIASTGCADLGAHPLKVSDSHPPIIAAEYIHNSGSNCDPKKIISFLQAGTNPNSDVNGIRLLSLALIDGADQCVLALMEHGATVHFETPLGPFLSHALTFAAGAAACDPAVIDALVKNGANPDKVDPVAGTPLTNAALEKNSACAATLIRAGATVNRAVGLNGITPLMFAQFQGGADKLPDIQQRTAMTKLLLAAGANPNRQTKPVVGSTENNAGETALFFAVGLMKPFEPCASCAALLLKAGADPDAYDASGRTPMLWALMPDHRTTVEAIHSLVKGGADFDISNAKTGETPVMAAAALGDTDIVNYLVNAGADVCAVDKKGHNAAYYAQMNHHDKLSEMLTCP